MASVATPEYVVEIVNPTPALPPVSERTPAMVMAAIESWEHWLDIKLVAIKEYGMSPNKFDALLPEYQRYLCLIMLGYTPLSMFSFYVDKIWHSHVLCSHLWADFTLRLHGRPINHVAQVPGYGFEDWTCKICITCESCKNCSGGGQGGGQVNDVHISCETAEEFAAAYLKVFGERPPAVWDLSSEADGCAAE